MNLDTIVDTIKNEEELEEAIAIIRTESIIALDTETTKTPTWKGRRLMGVSIWAPQANRGWYLPVGHNLSLFAKNFELPVFERIWDFVKYKSIVFHNAKFDLQVLYRAGFEDYPGAVSDTMIASWIFNENESHSLKDLGVKYVDPMANVREQELKKLEKSVGWDNIPAELMGRYAVKDVELTWKLWEHYLPMLHEERELAAAYQKRIEFLRVLMGIELRGVLIDRVQARQFAASAAKHMTQIQEELGIDPAKPSQLARKLFGPPPLGEGLLPLSYSAAVSKSFPNGRPDTSEAALKTYRNGVCGRVLEYRSYAKAKSTYYDAWVESLGEDGRLHPSYNQHGTRTGRLSCSGPNMQQIPRDMETTPVKSLLRATKGYDLWEFDYSQVELRLAAVYAQEPRMLQNFIDGADVHQSVAETLGVTRFLGKTINFLILYGGGSGKLAAVSGLTEREAKRILENYHSTYPGFRSISQEAEFTMRARGFVRLWSGRRRNLEHDWEAHKAFNGIIQGGAADIMVETMCRLDKADLPVNLVGQVHDSLWVEIPANPIANRDSLINQIKEIMEWPGTEFPIPFPVDSKCLYRSPE